MTTPRSTRSGTATRAAGRSPTPRQGDRITTPLVRDDDGTLRPASWSEALGVAARRTGRGRGSAGVLVGGRVTVEDAYAYAKFARIVLGTNDIDFRARPHSAEEAEFLAAHVAGRPMTVTYADLEKAPAVLLAGFEPEEESPIVFLRLRKAVRKHGLQVTSIAPFATRALTKLARPADRAGARRRGGRAGRPGRRRAADAARRDHPGRRTAGHLARRALGRRHDWRRRPAPGWRGFRAGPASAARWRPVRCPVCCPAAGRSATPSARDRSPPAWNVDELPTPPGRDTAGILGAARDGELGALLVGGVELADLPDPDAALAAIDAAPFVVSLELRDSAVTERADVVFPVAPVVEKAGTFVNWEGRVRPFEPSLHTNATPDLRVLASWPTRSASTWACATPRPRGEELARLGTVGGTRGRRTDVPRRRRRRSPARARPCWPAGACCSTPAGCRTASRTSRAPPDRRSRGCRRPPPPRSASADGDLVTVSTERGEITLPLAITDMPDRVVWLPLNSPGSAVHRQLGVTPGAVVSIGRAAAVTYPDPTLFGHDPWWLVLVRTTAPASSSARPR